MSKNSADYKASYMLTTIVNSNAQLIWNLMKVETERGDRTCKLQLSSPLPHHWATSHIDDKQHDLGGDDWYDGGQYGKHQIYVKPHLKRTRRTSSVSWSWLRGIFYTFRSFPPPTYRTSFFFPSPLPAAGGGVARGGSCTPLHFFWVFNP